MREIRAIPAPGSAITVDTGAIPAHVAENLAQALFEAIKADLQRPEFQAELARWKAERRQTNGTTAKAHA